MGKLAGKVAVVTDAIDTITRTLAKELGPRKIRVTAVNPGLVSTEGLQTSGLAGSEFEAQIIALTPLGRAGHPDDIAPVVVFLASEDAHGITGDRHGKLYPSHSANSVRGGHRRMFLAFPSAQ